MRKDFAQNRNDQHGYYICWVFKLKIIRDYDNC